MCVSFFLVDFIAVNKKIFMLSIDKENKRGMVVTLLVFSVALVVLVSRTKV